MGTTVWLVQSPKVMSYLTYPKSKSIVKRHVMVLLLLGPIKIMLSIILYYL